jgi:amino acid adenylation domain-containing protein/non-ribosomal peptide synthase protein (TIGR01720 family)
MSHAYPGAQRLNAPQHVDIHHVLEDWAVRTPDAPVLVASGRVPLTYGRLHRHIYDVVQKLRALGVGCEDRVALVLPTGPEMAVAFLAVAVGAVCAPLNPASSTDEFELYLADLDAKTLIVPAGTETPARAVAQVRGLKIIELSPVLEAEAGLFTLAGEEHPHAGRHGFTQPNDVALVLPTSGTTSRPKIVPLTHTHICTAAHNIRLTLELSESDRCLNVLPLFHAHALLTVLLTTLVAGASCVCNASFTPTEFFASMVEFRPTWYTAVPTVHQAILASAAQHRETIAGCPLRFIRSASAPLPGRILAELERVFKAPVLETYGMTETAAQITSNPLPPRPRKPGSVGVTAGPEVAIISPEGALLPVGQIGEIVVRGPTVFQGYQNDPTANRSAFTNGWFRTGDEGLLDRDGYLFITGRLREIINRGGEKIAPQEVDNVLMEHPAVAQAVTFAVLHARLGEDLAAAVVLHQNAAATEQEIRLFVATRLAAFKVPQQVHIVEDLPKSPTGKVQRLGLAEKLSLTALGQAEGPMHRGHTAPRTPMEELLAGLWARVLDIERVGIHDDFFQLGGDSLLAMLLLARVRETVHVGLSFYSFFETPTVADMARSIGTVRQAVTSLQPLPPQPVPRDGALPLSYAQQRLWFLEQLEPSRAVYNLPLAWRLIGNLNVFALERSLGEMVRRHEILRTTFPSVDGHPMQVIAPVLALPLPVVDLQALPATEREAAVERLATEEARRPFDLACGPLVRTTLLRLSHEDHVLLLTLHHIIFDGWSAEVFWRELATFYTAICTGQPLSLPVLLLQYADFAVRQRQWLQGEVLEAQLAYWRQRLGDTLPVLDLPTDRPRPPVQTFQGARQSLMLPASFTAALKALSQRQGVTLFMTVVAAFQTLLCRYTGQTDLVVGTPLTGRTRVEIEGLLGFFVNTLILRSDLSGNPCFRELLKRVRAVMLGAYDHQDLPFEKLVEALQPARDLSRNPLVQVMIALHPPPPPPTELPGLTVRPVILDCGTAKFDLTLFVQDTDQGLLATVEYNTDLFDPGTIVRMLGHFHTLLEGIIADPEQRLADLPLLTSEERQQLLVEWTNITVDYPQDTCLHALFEAQVERRPDTAAVVCDAQQLTYSALNRRANQLAHHVRALGVGPEVCVGLCVERSLEMVVGLLGILKAGGAYVPLDPTYPTERLATMVADARVAVLVTQQRCMAAFPALGIHVVCLDTDWEHMAQQSEVNPVCEVVPGNLAYVLYTSGSTGTPKGVMVEHREVLAFLHGFEHVAPGGEGCIGTAVCPFSFDVSAWECFSMLGFGGTLHIIPPELMTNPEQFVDYLADNRITSTYIPPSLLSDVASHLEQQRAQTALTRLLVGVEPIQQGTLQRFRNLSERMDIVNGYGPTETTICATLFPFNAATEPDRRTPIGTGIRGYEVYLVDTNMQLVPIGIPGELCIGGVGLARGYINHPELTAERFIPHPFSTVPGARLYKTGDLARYLPDGTLEFLGRDDLQVKVRGYRIELEEIEAALRQYPEVRETVVMAQEDARRGDKRLVAYLVPTQETAPASHTFRTFLQQKLPAYMIPSSFMVLEALPRTPTGKIDRQALPFHDTTPSPSAVPFLAPRTPVESTLAGIWADVLGREQVGVHDNFFRLGGDSIQSIQIVARANQAGFQLTPKHLFQHQTIAELATVAYIIPAIYAEQGLVTGLVPLMPIQQWFFEQDLAEPHHWNQSMLLKVSQTLDCVVLERVIQHLLVHHDMLRARFSREADGWQQNIVGPEASSLCVRVDLSALSETQQITAIPEAAAQVQANLNLAQGPLVRIALVDCGPLKSARLLVVIHHLVVDSVSWRILLEDLHTAYQQLSAGRAIQLPPKTASFKHWAERLTAYAQSAELRRELTYWLAAPRAQVGRLPVDYPGGANTVALARTVSVSLSTTETHALLREVPRAYQTQMNDVLLTALVQAFARWTGESTLLIDLEGHGREEIVENVDLSRTVGWFTSIFPILLQLEHADTPAETLKSVKEQLQRIPRRGIGYGVLRYLSQDTEVIEKLRALPQAEVCFNYLGRADQVVSGPVFFGPVRETSGPHRSARGRRRYLLEVNSRLVGGQLQLDWTYSEHIHRRDTIERLAQGFIEALHTLIVHCQVPGVGGYTPSDFPAMRLSQPEFDELMTALGESAERDQQ